jgi:hypothetical protein
VTDDRYLYVDDHGDTLAGGLRVNNGDEVPASQVTDADQWLIDDGKLVSLTRAEKAAAQTTTDEEA